MITKPNITLVPTGGLCNRLVAIHNAIKIAEQDTNIHFDIKWWKNKECYADFSDLFKPIEMDNICVTSLLHYYERPSNKKNLHLPSLFRLFKFQTSYNISPIIANQDVTSTIKGYSNIYIASNCRFSTCEEMTHVSDYFVPTPDIQKEISAITSHYTGNTIGIHVRRTDNKLAITNRPTDWFHNKMNAEIQKDRQCKFYIASDDAQVVEELTEKYQGHVIKCVQKELRRDSVKGIKDATVELFCLGKCNKIIGSGYSTFSRLAADLYNAKLEI